MMKSFGWPRINRIIHRDGGRRRQDAASASIGASASQDMPGGCPESGSEGHWSSMDTENRIIENAGNAVSSAFGISGFL